MRRVVDLEDLRQRLEPRLAVEGLRHRHVQHLRIREAEGKGGKLVALGLQIEVLDVVDGGVAEHEAVAPLEQLLDAGIKLFEIGIFFEIVVVVRENDAVAAVVCQVKFPVRVDEDVLLL